MHIPVLGPKTVHAETTEVSEKENPRAGIKNLLRERSTLTVQPRPKATDMKKPAMIARSPAMIMSPVWVNHKLERFNGIGRMIWHWEEMERREE